MASRHLVRVDHGEHLGGLLLHHRDLPPCFSQNRPQQVG